MLAERDRGATRDLVYPDCVIAVTPDTQAGLGPEEIRALRVLAEAGLLPTASAAQVLAAQPPVTPVTPVSAVNRRPAAAARGAGSRPAAARSGYRKNSSHPQLKSHNPRPALRGDRQDRAESRRIG